MNSNLTMNFELSYLIIVILIMISSICWTIYDIVISFTDKNKLNVQANGLKHDIYIGIISILIAIYIIPKFWVCSIKNCVFEHFELKFIRTVGVFLLITGIGHIITDVKWLHDTETKDILFNLLHT